MSGIYAFATFSILCCHFFAPSSKKQFTLRYVIVWLFKPRASTDLLAMSAVAAPPLVQRVASLQKSMDMNADAIALLLRKAQAVKEAVELQDHVNVDHGVNEKYQEKIEELTAQVTSTRNGFCVLKVDHDKCVCRWRTISMRLNSWPKKRERFITKKTRKDSSVNSASLRCVWSWVRALKHCSSSHHFVRRAGTRNHATARA